MHMKSTEPCLTGSMPVKKEQFQPDIYSEFCTLGGWPIDATHAIPMGGIRVVQFVSADISMEIVATSREGYAP